MTATQLALRVDTPTRDPHVLARRYVVEAIRHVASHNHGRVSMNAVRALLADVGAVIPRGVTGATVQSLKRAGRLVRRRCCAAAVGVLRCRGWGGVVERAAFVDPLADRARLAAEEAA
jgi:hypothetical protein